MSLFAIGTFAPLAAYIFYSNPLQGGHKGCHSRFARDGSCCVRRR